METVENKPTAGENILNGLKKATIELEEFLVQISLGKAEAKDTFEELKKKFDSYLFMAKNNFENIKDISKEKISVLKSTIESLQVQLALGKAETKDAFDAQQTKLNKTLNEVEDFIKNNKFANEQYSNLLLEIGKFKLKLDILKMRYELGKLEARIEFKDKKKELAKKIAEVEARFVKKGGDTAKAWGDFTDEISDAYSHFKKAILK